MPFIFEKVLEMSLPNFLSNILTFTETIDFHQYMKMLLYITWTLHVTACSFEWELYYTMVLSDSDKSLCLPHNGMSSSEIQSEIMICSNFEITEVETYHNRFPLK